MLIYKQQELGVLSPVERRLYTDTVQLSDWNSFKHSSCSVSGEKCTVSWLLHKINEKNCD